MKIPKHIKDHIDLVAEKYHPSTGSTDAITTTYDHLEFVGKDSFVGGAEYGYSLAMEEMKPILDAARELINWPSMTDEYQSSEVTDSISKLSQLLKQYDNEQGN